MQWVYDNDFDSFSLEIGDYLVSRNILLSDIVEATFMVKVNSRDADSQAIVTLVLGNGLTKTAGDTEADAVILASFRASDFTEGGLVAGKNYYMGLGIKTAGMPKFLEIVPVIKKLTILSDFIHD